MSGQGNDVVLAANWFADNWPSLVTGAIQIVVILAVALAVRALVHRAIDKLTKGTGEIPPLLRPLRERAPQAVGVQRSERRRQRAMTIGSMLKSVTTLLVYGVAFITAMQVLGLPLTPIIASVSVVGVAVGFGAQSLVRDFLSGIFMMLEDQYGVGDVIDVGQATGTVESVGLRVTTLRDVNGTVWYVRNGEVARVGNSSQGFAVAVVDVPLGHHGSLDQALDVLGEVAEKAVAQEPLSEDVLEAPQVLGVEKVTPESITLRLTVKVRPGRQWATQRTLRARVMAAFVAAGIEPPVVRHQSLGEPEPPKPQPARASKSGGEDSKNVDLGF
ncbi:mechanosensitive ion channel [Kutzneria viridogrisea]|uniref:MscS mechanosensitive ion channel n=2 Tax=Kutzneria TaxID=43356 RepID=W5W2Z7_9PSEU|nr:mechanosensitive ion channel family protein [Kutzneria albida]AHH94881.1 MscS mechanosensitive ion channel [Kutzneria albida DSM 43870]MBA8927775.1 small conductance mechanosensitive channel [Kutzneria viridogrisea]